jgi:hypothetical protein
MAVGVYIEVCGDIYAGVSRSGSEIGILILVVLLSLA